MHFLWNNLFKLLFLAIIFFAIVQAITIRKGDPIESEYGFLSPIARPIIYSGEVIKSLTGPTLRSVVAESQKGTTGKYSMYIKNLKTGETYASDEHTPYLSASLYKLWVMAVVYQNIEQKKFKETDTLQSNIEELNKRFDIASESAELKTGTIKLTVSQALSQMITISHNYAALLLAQKVGLPQISTFLINHGFNESAIGQPPKTTAYDMAYYLEKLYNKELVTQEASEKMIELLKKQQLNDRIPKYLPDEDVEVAHKTGELFYVKHDVGIVYTRNGDYIFIVLSETKNPQAAAERIAKLSKAVFDYFQL